MLGTVWECPYRYWWQRDGDDHGGGEPFLNIWRGRPSGRWVGSAEHIISDDPLDPPMVISSVWARGLAEPPTLMPDAVRCFEQEYRRLLAREATP